MTVIGSCTHERVYWDLDEEKCQSCGASLTYPPHIASEEEQADAKAFRRADSYDWSKLAPGPPIPPIPPKTPKVVVGSVSCIGCSRQQVPGTPNQSGKVSCDECSATLVLQCNCCKELLPDLAFYYDAARTSRECLTARCRRCFSEHSRLKRLQDPEPNRARARAYSRKIQAERVIGERPPVSAGLTDEQKVKSRAAVKRVIARQGGQDVPRLRPGRTNIYIKQVCRISASCPLATFCTTEVKGLG